MHVFLTTDGSQSARSAEQVLSHFPWETPHRVTIATVCPAADLHELENDVTSPVTEMLDRCRNEAAQLLLATAERCKSWAPQVDRLLLDDHLLRPEARGRGVSVSELLTLLHPIITTLERGHELGIVHRDLKPGNVFVLARSWQGEASGEYQTRGQELSSRVRLLDYGFCHASDTRSITPHGTVLGSPSYIAPEVWRGRAGAPDPAIDIYSLGAIVFRLLAGRVPFEADSLRRKLELVCTGERPSLHALRPDLPVEIDDWVQQVLAIQPKHRFSRVGALWAALQEALGEHIFEWFLRNKRAEWGAYRTHVSSFELNRYLRTW